MLHKTRPPAKRLPARIPASRRPQPKKTVHFLPDPKDEQHDSAFESEAASKSGSSSGSASDEGFDVARDEDDNDDDDADTPRVVQWVDVDSEAESQAEEKSDDDDNESDTHDISSAKPSRDLRSLEDDLSSLPLGMLRKAQRTLARARALSDSESESDVSSEASDDDAPPRSTIVKGKEKEKQERDLKPRKDLAKRSSKHAPTEITSKRPVSRRRTVVESKAPQPRDPRFLHITGDYKPEKFRQQYNFLTNLHTDELRTLRENLKRARKLLANSPQDLRPEREREVGRLERAVKRGESTVNLDRREKVETEALQKVTREEREKRQQGKTGWWMKSSEKKELLTKARYEEIASTGGKRAVKRAIEKKQKKIGQKEKRSRPFPASQAGNSSGGGQKRPARFAIAEEGSKASKRRKFV